MSVNIPNNFILEFNTATALLRQIRGGKFRSRVMNGTHRGEGASPVNQYGTVEMAAPAARFAPVNAQDIEVTRRWVYPLDRELPQFLDRADLVRLIEDPKGPMSEAAALAVGREEDIQIINGLIGEARVGKQGATTEAFDTANFNIAAAFGGGAGLTVDKLRRARRIFGQANVDLEVEMPYLAVGPAQMDDLLAQVEVTSKDFNSGMALETGRVMRYLGFEIFETNLLPLSGADRTCIAFVKSGGHFGTWMSPQSRIDEVPALSMTPYLLKTTMITGATRLEQGRVITIQCTEA